MRNIIRIPAMMTMGLIISINLFAQDIKLPEPRKTGGKPLMNALNDRESARAFSEKDLSLQQLSDLLWAAWGINRPETSKRTAPSSRNVQEIDVYVILKSGLFLYNAGDNSLKQIHNTDIRKLSGTQEYVATAPVNLIYVADMGKLGKKEGDKINDADLFAPYANSGFIAQNVYLWCASENMSCVIRAMIDRPELAREMKLRSNQVIILGQTVGMPLN
jgi:nitroreductase